MAYRKEEESTIEQNTELLDQSETETEDELTDVDTEESEPVTSSQTINALAKPVFVPKKSRLTVKEKKEIEREEQKRIEAEQKRLEERRKQSKELVIQTLVAQNMHQEIENEVNCVDDKDELTEEEYELWKIRELKRIIRDRNERNAHERLVSSDVYPIMI
uniref:Micro-fibrillar-associated protein 1 C-terminus containing protein n=1 Tax=Babesia bovis TaxID=5865 RepID=S6BGV5_BABBO|nr:micro-fibrillar-associated protein 1 C-terminus containing protein [Babesia bovis]